MPMSLNIVRVVRDNIHGTIDLSHIEDRVIAHPYFQRLRRVKQTAFLSNVFPGATHTRFEHSLGTLHLARVAMDQIIRNQSRLFVSIDKIKGFEKKERAELDKHHGLLTPAFSAVERVLHSPYNQQVLRVAAMLHDIGHSAFSHSGEPLLPTMEKVIEANPEIPEYLKKYFQDLGANHFKNKPVRHEVYSILGAYTILTDTGVDKQIDPRDVLCVIAPEIGPSPQSPLMEFGVYHLFHEMLSGELDVDRMDYLGRDTRECGVIYGMFDLTRVLDSICAYYNPQSKSLHLGIQYSGLAAFEDYLRARQSMYLNLYFHKTSVACEAMLKTIRDKISGVHFPAKSSEYFRLDEYNIYAWFEKSIKEHCDPNEKDSCLALLERLLTTRVLWKKLYEFSDQKPGTLAHIKNVENILQQEDIQYQRVNTSNVLTRLKSRRNKMGLSQNRFHVIKKDNDQIPRVVPIETVSALVRNPEEIFISRIYVDRESMDKNSLDKIKEKVDALS